MAPARRVLHAVAAATAIVVSHAAVAAAATVTVVSHGLVYTASGQGTNDLRVARHADVVVVRDLGATLTAGAGCTPVNPHKATCPATGIRSFTASLGPGADRAVIATLLQVPSIVVRGGAGADVLQSVLAHVELLGGPGRDHLIGGVRADVLRGKRGADWLRSGGGADRLYGGPGKDVVEGGPGADRAYGGLGDDLMYGGPGSDRQYGGPGDDIINDFSGHDRLIGGPGEDYLNAFERVPDGAPGDFLDAGRGPDYGCRATPDDTLVGCDEAAGPFPPPPPGAAWISRLR
jgi:Ca2+-binding RTX toxin-like protein